MARPRAHLLIPPLLWAVGCLHPGEERAQRDLEQVGRAVAGEVAIEVEPGAVLAAEEDPPRFAVRASAPVVELRLEGTGRAEVTIGNLTADAEVTGEGLVAASAPAPGVRRVEVVLPAAIRAAPADGGPRPVRLAYSSDFHVDTDAMAALVDAVDADPAIEMVLCGGDLVDKGSRQDEWDRVMALLADLPVPFYSTAGNHEINGDDGASFHRRLGRMSFVFDYHGVRVAFADSAAATFPPAVLDLLDRELGRAPAAAVSLLVTHTPILDSSGLRNGGFSSRLEAERTLALLARRGVDLLLHGHVHACEAYRSAGIPTYIANGGGGRDNQFDGIGPHFLVIDADPAARAIAVSRRDLD
jgi:predicted phosphodiesterase